MLQENGNKIVKGSLVVILRPESFWYKQEGIVINIEQNVNIKYPISVRFNAFSYSNATVANFKYEEVLLLTQ